MTTINCSSNCIHQKDGKCMLNNTIISSVSFTSDCVFFQEKPSFQQNTKSNKHAFN